MNVLYETKCGHLLSLNPKNIDLRGTYDCRFCGSATVVSGVQLMEYRAKCGDCSWTRYTGMSSGLATYVANRHATSKSHFNVKVEFVANPAAVKERERIERGKLLDSNGDSKIDEQKSRG